MGKHMLLFLTLLSFSLSLSLHSRSSTGVGEYQFKTSQSVQITHAIETVVKKLKYEALGSSQQVCLSVCLSSSTDDHISSCTCVSLGAVGPLHCFLPHNLSV